MMGNYMDNYRQMGIAGIDMTHGAASDAITIGANVAKQATSMSEFNNSQYTFCEIGQDEGYVNNVKENIANVAVLQSMGINYMASYYHLTSEEDTSLLANSLARINYMLAGNVSDKNLGVYYPIEGIFCDETPYNSKGQIIYTGNWGFNEYVTEISNNYRLLVQSLVRNQIDYNIFSAYSLTNSKIEDGALITPNGQRFETLIIPYTSAIETNVLNKLLEASNNGVNIILQDINSLLCIDSDKQEEMNNTLLSLKEKATNINNRSFNSILTKLDGINNLERVNLDKKYPDIVARKQNNNNSTLYMLVNTSNKEQALTLITDEVGKEYRSWNVYDGYVDGMAVKVKDGKSYLNINIPAFGVGIYTIE